MYIYHALINALSDFLMVIYNYEWAHTGTKYRVKLQYCQQQQQKRKND